MVVQFYLNYLLGVNCLLLLLPFSPGVTASRNNHNHIGSNNIFHHNSVVTSIANSEVGEQQENNRTDIANSVPRWRNDTVYMSNIFLKVYGENNDVVYDRSVSHTVDYEPHYECQPWAPFAIIVHGWRESCETEWVPMLVEKLRKHRGGCIMCFDYSHYSHDIYHRLVRNFDPIANALTIVLFQLQDQGIRMELGYAFGFSFGGQLVTEAGRRIGYYRLHEVDTCDMAGPGFDHRLQPDQRLAAQNVQCVHTSRDKGTHHFNCHQNWRLGNCGYTQPAAGDPPLGSHGLCPYIYISAFDHEFLAVPKPLECVARTPALSWPSRYRLGYLERRKYSVRGELFSLTTAQWPYVDDQDTRELEILTLNLPYNGDYGLY